jgi:membrane-associated protein
MTELVDRILGTSPVVVCAIVFLVVFAEDAFLVGFVIPGETAAIVGGVAAARDHVPIGLMIAVVVVAAILGDTVGYEVGRRYGSRLLEIKPLKKRQARVDEARAFIAHRGGVAVFLGRFTAFFRALMPGVAGAARMRYPTFLLYNAAGGLIWGTGAVVLGFIAGNSWERLARAVGQDVALVVGAIVVLGVVAWVVRRRRAERRAMQR